MFPFYYDSRYDEEPNYYDTGRTVLEESINVRAEEMLGHRLSGKEMKYVKRQLSGEGYLQRNPGDPDFTDKLSEILRRLTMARKVAAKCLQI
jgi:hypothetical protein